MKLLTKAWYQTMQDSGLGVQLRADERAAVFSEELFQTFWQKKLSDMLAMREDICYEYDIPWDEEEETRYFENNYRREMEIFQTRTPERILAKVADIRLLALGFCTREVYDDLKEYRDLCRKWTEKTMEEAWNMRFSQGLCDAWTGEYSLHDSVVLSMKREGEDLLIEFECDEEATWPEIRGVRFRDAKILKQEEPLEKTFWLYDEIWRTGEGSFEIHALLWRGNEVFELTISCRETELIWTVEPKREA